MSYCGAFPVDDQQSESHILIDAVLARVREEAHLDDASVLSPLHSLIEPPPKPRRESAFSHLRSAPLAAPAKGVSPARVELAPASRSGGEVAVGDEPKSFVDRMRWAVLLCGFLAGTFGGVALMKSPLGHGSAVQRVVNEARSQVGQAISPSR